MAHTNQKLQARRRNSRLIVADGSLRPASLHSSDWQAAQANSAGEPVWARIESVLEFLEFLLRLRVIRVLLQQILQNRSRLLAIAFNGVDTGQV